MVQTRRHGTALAALRRRLRLGADRDHGEGGFVLLESVIALAVISIIMAAIGAEFVGAMASTDHQRDMQAAVQIGDSEAERVRSLHPSDLVLGRDATSVSRQYANAPTVVQPWLATMNQISDTKASFPSGRTAALPTSVSSSAPLTMQKPSQITYSVLDYLGSCYIAVQGTTCQKTAPVGAIPYLRDVITVTWSGPHCTPLCSYITTTLISGTSDQTFQVNQPLPPAPTAADVNETVAVGDTLSALDSSAIQLLVDNGKGVAPFTWALKNGAKLPTNLGLSPTGLISGTVGAPAGHVDTQVVVTDAFLRTATMTVHWNVEQQLTVTPVNPQAAVVNTPITPKVTLTASGGDGAPYTWSDPGKTLPPGLSLATNGDITGTPTKVGLYNVSVQVVDKGGQRSSTGAFTWTISYPPVTAPTVTTQTNTIGVAISPLTLTAAGGDGNFVWSDPTGSLPTGLTISSAGVINGTPSVLKNFSVSLQVADPSAGGGSNYTKTVTFNWNVVAKPSVTAPANQTSSVTSPVNVALTSTCPHSPCTYALNAKAPGGLTVSSTGVISGTISGAAGTYSGVTVTVTDSQGVSTTSGSFTWTVNPAPTLTGPGDQTTLRKTTVSLDMSTGVSGGTSPYTYSATGLPTGLSINAGTGKITGTTANANSTSSVTVTVRDSTNATATATFSWNVTNLAIAVQSQTTFKSTSVSLDLDNWTSGGSGPYSYTISALPAGLTLSNRTNIISGTVGSTASTTKNIVVTVTDNAGATITSAPFDWYVTTLKIATIGTQSQVRNTTANVNLSTFVSGGTKPYTFSATNLPAWLTINPSTGVVSGKAPNSTSTTSNVTITVQDNTGATVTSNAFAWKVT